MTDFPDDPPGGLTLFQALSSLIDRRVYAELLAASRKRYMAMERAKRELGHVAVRQLIESGRVPAASALYGRELQAYGAAVNNLMYRFNEKQVLVRATCEYKGVYVVGNRVWINEAPWKLSMLGLYPDDSTALNIFPKDEYVFRLRHNGDLVFSNLRFYAASVSISTHNPSATNGAASIAGAMSRPPVPAGPMVAPINGGGEATGPLSSAPARTGDATVPVQAIAAVNGKKERPATREMRAMRDKLLVEGILTEQLTAKVAHTRVIKALERGYEDKGYTLATFEKNLWPPRK
jgi:hypothetical protein